MCFTVVTREKEMNYPRFQWLASLMPLIVLYSVMLGLAPKTIASQPVVQGREPSFPFISGDTFRYYADHIADETSFPIDPKSVKENDVVFLKTDYMPEFFQHIHPNITNRYILITHNSDYSAPKEFRYILEDQKLIAWFAQNPDYVHPKLHPIPLAIANRYWSHGDVGMIQRVQKFCKNLAKNTLLFMQFAVWTYPQERQRLELLMKTKPFCQQFPRLDSRRFLTELARSKFVLSPRGNGLDTHRTWEALLMGAIPIVITSTLDPIFEDLPVLIINQWEDITEEFLEQKWIEMSSKKYRMEKLYADYWLNWISSFKTSGLGDCQKTTFIVD